MVELLALLLSAEMATHLVGCQLVRVIRSPHFQTRVERTVLEEQTCSIPFAFRRWAGSRQMLVSAIRGRPWRATQLPRS